LRATSIRRRSARDRTTGRVATSTVPDSDLAKGATILARSVELTTDDLREIDRIASQIPIEGARYPEALEARTGL
jgi:predicted nucleic acid-binding protein